MLPEIWVNKVGALCFKQYGTVLQVQLFFVNIAKGCVAFKRDMEAAGASEEARKEVCESLGQAEVKQALKSSQGWLRKPRKGIDLLQHVRVIIGDDFSMWLEHVQ